ncbi:MAG: ATP-binding protein [Candidatus Andeanibacterium colombiense]|uniref:histidine kinase n=1 Tax=Candidatus Andeanibacterium colombiense TaxID=3121345 RepID=A0AAJ5X4X3_9SPHN|nr:MAG: ATP-binding protein [Sphingomonadaceae bacterium]
MSRAHIWPDGLMGRVIAVLLAAIMLELLGSTLLYQYLDTSASREESARNLAEQLVVADRVLTAAPAGERPALARQLSSHHVTVTWRSVPVPDQTARNDDLREVRRIVSDWEGGLAPRDISLAVDHEDRAMLVGSIALPDGSYVQFSTRMRSDLESFGLSLLSLCVLFIGVFAAAALVIRALGSPLRNLADVADTAGHGPPVLLTEKGPQDLRALARAFNAMQLRVADLIASRTRALAAMSHDLRTPLTRLKLRSELIEDDPTQAAMGKDIQEMEHMLDSVLAYLAGVSDAEEPRRIDLAALAMTLADDAADVGQAVEYSGPDSLHATMCPLRTRRALGNLIDNALHYGERAVVRLSASEEGIHLVVEDDGPGIPAEELQEVVEPFRRLDYARPRNTEGMGLGLSIVSDIMQREGGELRLENREPHGLRAELFFPNGRAVSATL